eukprot:scaffold682235_cov59-Prasinocladus_malaysianus.AAC.1
MGLVRSVDAKARVATITWFKQKAADGVIEPPTELCNTEQVRGGLLKHTSHIDAAQDAWFVRVVLRTAWCVLQVSVYEIREHPDYQYRIGDV